jgi:TonB family protein
MIKSKMKALYLILLLLLPFTAQSQNTKDSISFNRDCRPEYDRDKFIKINTRYPLAARRIGEEATIIVFFAIDTNGYVCDVKAIKEGSSTLVFEEEFKAEAIRVIKLMPPWQPAIFKGTPIKTKKKINIRFSLTI